MKHERTFLCLISLLTVGVWTIIFQNASFIKPHSRPGIDVANKEVWISARTNALGTSTLLGSGAITNPYYGDFDFIVNTQTTNTTIHLLPGVHYTKGFETYATDMVLKASQRILGAGIDTTIIKKDNRFHNDDAMVFGILWSQADSVEAADLTVDCSGSPSRQHKIVGVMLTGNNCALRRVKVINWCGNIITYEEAPAIQLGSAGTSNNLITGCICTSAQGTCDDGIGLQGRGIVSGNSVTLPLLTTANAKASYPAYLATATINAIFRDNYSYGGRFGFYTDTGSETNITIANNSFENVFAGIVLTKAAGDHVHGIAIKDNTVELTTNLVAYSAWGICLYSRDPKGASPYDDIAVSGNAIRYYNGQSKGGSVQTLGIAIGGPSDTNFHNVRIFNNTVDRSFSFFSNAKGNWFSDNIDVEGVPLHFRSVTSGSGTLNLNQIDEMVLVSSMGITTVSLPSAWGFSGKQITIVNKNSTANLGVTSVSGTRIMNAAFISPSQTATFVSDGLSTWIRR